MSQSLLDRGRRLLLRAALGTGGQAAIAYSAWRDEVAIDDLDYAAIRVMPSVIATAQRLRIQDPELARLQGMSKHVWLQNMLLSRALADALAALEAAGIAALVFKGAALFARAPEQASLRGVGDYDVLVRPETARRAFACLAAAGFTAEPIQVDRFIPADFDRIHGAPFTRGMRQEALDLHWRPLPSDTDPALTESLFAAAEPAHFAGRAILIPNLADHLLLSVARPEPGDAPEIFLRAVEAALLLRGCAGRLDWERFLDQASRFGFGERARSLLALIRAETGAPMPADILDRLAALPVRAWAPSAARPAPRTLEAIWREQARRDIDFFGLEPSFLDGFSLPEATGRWTDARLATLAIPLAAPPSGPIEIRLRVSPFYAPGTDAFVFESCVGPGTVTRHRLDFSDGTSRDVILTGATVVPGPNRVVILLRPLDAQSPAQLGLSADVRLLGLQIQAASAVEAITDTSSAIARLPLDGK